MDQTPWVKKVENPISRPLNDWRDELYGYWMLISNAKMIDGVEMVTALFYGTDKIKLFEIRNNLREQTDDLTLEVLMNKQSNWLGGAFLAKASS